MYVYTVEFLYNLYIYVLYIIIFFLFTSHPYSPILVLVLCFFILFLSKNRTLPVFFSIFASLFIVSFYSLFLFSFRYFSLPPSLSSSNIHFCCFHCIFLFFFLSLSFLLCRKLLWLKYITDVNEKNVLEREKETKRRKRREYFVSRRRIIRKYTAAVICIAFHVNPSK